MTFITRLNKKVVLGTIALGFAALFIVISSFFPFIIDPDQWTSKEFISNVLIVVAIVIFTMVSAINIGQANNAQDSRSELAKSKVKFIDSSSKIDNISRFCQWVKNVLQVNDIIAIKERKMRLVGIEDFTLLKLDIIEIKQLLNGPQKFNGKYYPTLTKRQVECLINLKEGRYDITLVEPMYYLTVKAIDNERTITERSGDEAFKKAILVAWSTICKLILTLIPTLIFAGLVRDTSQGVETATAWLRFISRMSAMISSAFMGYLVGCQINDIDAEYINMRVLVHTQYSQDTTFVAKTQEELNKEAYEKLHPEEFKESEVG